MREMQVQNIVFRQVYVPELRVQKRACMPHASQVWRVQMQQYKRTLPFVLLRINFNKRCVLSKTARCICAQRNATSNSLCSTDRHN